MADCVQRLAQEMVNSDYLWNRLDTDGKINLLRASMGLPIKPRDGHNFKGDAPMVFDGIPSNMIELPPSENPELPLKEENEDATRPKLGNPVDNQVKNRTLFVKIHQEEYLISWEVLDQVFSRVGNIEVIEIFDNNSHYHSRIRFKNHDSVIKAFDSLNGRCIYDYCCRMELFVDGSSDDSGQHQNQSSIENFGAGPSDKVEEIEIPSSHLVNSSQQSVDQSSSVEKIEDRQEIDDAHNVFDKLTGASSDKHVERSEHKILEAPPHELNLDSRNRSFSIDSEFRGNSPLLHLELSNFEDCSSVRQCEKHSRMGGIFDAQQVFDEMPDLQICLEPELSVEFGLSDFKLNSIEYLGEIPIAHKVLVEMPRYGMLEMEPVVISREVDFLSIIDGISNKNRLWVGNLGFDPGIRGMCSLKWFSVASVWFSNGDLFGNEFCLGMSAIIFDPGGVFALFDVGSVLEFGGYNPVIEAKIKDQRCLWDPGGIDAENAIFSCQ